MNCKNRLVFLLVRGVLVCSIVWLSGCVTSQGGVQADDHKTAGVRLELATNYYRAGRLEVALEELDASIKLGPTAEAYSLQGLILSTIGKYQDAEEAYQQSVRLAPKNSAINNSYGWFLCQSNREAESIAYFERALEDPLYQTPELPIQNIGLCFLKQKNYEKASFYLLQALEVNPNTPQALLGLVKSKMAQEQWKAAEGFYMQYLRFDSQPSEEVLWLGVRVAYYAGSGAKVRERAALLKEKFPYSSRYQAYVRRDFDFE
jgi:type IV pilus assembly protein PilF